MSKHRSDSGSEIRHVSVARSTAWNIAGLVVPVFIAFFSIPVLVRGMGVDRFGVLSLAWMVIGYFSLFDFGIGRALTKLVAERIGEKKYSDIPDVTWAALWLMLIFGGLGAAVVGILSPWLARDVLEIPAALRVETRNTFYLLAFSLPVVISTAALRGFLEAYQRFDLANAIRIPLGMAMFGAPLLILPFTPSLPVIVSALVGVRVVSWGAHYWACLHVAPELRQMRWFSVSMAKPLLRFGGWMSISNLISPLMVYMDRFLIGAVVSSAAVTFYVTPYEMVTKLWLVPGALLGVLFPALATLLVQNRRRGAELFDRTTILIALALFPCCLFGIFFAPEGLGLWLGRDFVEKSSAVCRWLIVGVFFNSLAQVAFAFVQAHGRPDLTAKLHAIELPFYIVGLWWLLPRYGIDGVAIIWTLRMVVDMAILFYVARRLEPLAGMSTRHVAVGFLVLLVFCAAMLPQASGWKLAEFLLLLGAFVPMSWRYLLCAADRGLVLAMASKLFGRRSL